MKPNTFTTKMTFTNMTPIDIGPNLASVFMKNLELIEKYACTDRELFFELMKLHTELTKYVLDTVIKYTERGVADE